MKKILALFVLSLMSGWVFAQSTTVSTAGVVDHDSSVWIGGTYTIQFKPNPSFPSIGSYVWSGGNLQNNLQFAGTLDGSGAFSVSIPDNTTITPAGSAWNFIICPNATSGCFNTALPVNGSTFSVTTQLNALANGPRFPVGGSAHGYADIEITPTPLPGGTYYNVTTNFIRVWNGTSWSNIGGGGGSGQVLASPQFQIGFFPSPGTVATVQGSGATTDASGNVETLSTNGMPDAFKHQTTPTSNNGIHNALQTLGNQVLVGPDYASTEAPVGQVSADWRIPLDFVDAAFFYSQSPGYAPGTMFTDQRYNCGGVSCAGIFVYNPVGYQTGIAPPSIYNRTYADQQPPLTGQGITTVDWQFDHSDIGSGKNASGIPDARAGWVYNWQSTRSGISSPWGLESQCMGNGDCHNIQNTALFGLDSRTGSDEGLALYRNQLLADFIVYTATSPSTQAVGTKQILGTYLVGIAGNDMPLIDTTQSSATFLGTVASLPSGIAFGVMNTSNTYSTLDTICNVTANFDETAIPMQYNGGTTRVTVALAGCTAAITADSATVGSGCWVSFDHDESLHIFSVGTPSGSSPNISQSIVVDARLEHLAGPGNPSHFSQGPQACHYMEAMANRVQGGSNAPLRDWARVIGATAAHALLYTSIGAGLQETWPNGAFTSFNIAAGQTLTRDGAGHTSMTLTSFFGNVPFNNAFLRIIGTDSTYTVDAQVTATTPSSGTVVLTWANSGSAGTTTTSAPTYFIVNQPNLGGNFEANAMIMFPGCLVTYTGNPSTNTMDGSNLCEANNITFASGDQEEVQHGAQPIVALNHNLIGLHTPTSASLGVSSNAEELTGELNPHYVWDSIFVALNSANVGNNGESELAGGGGTRAPDAGFLHISGDRIWGNMFQIPMPNGDLFSMNTCQIASGPTCTIIAPQMNFFDIQNVRNSFQMGWSDWNRTFNISNNAKTFFNMDSVAGFSMNGNDGAGNTFLSSFGFSGTSYAVGNVGGDLSTASFGIGTVATSVKVGANTSNFSQTSTAFAMDHPLSVQGSPVCTVASPCSAITLTTTGTSGAATLTGTVLNIPIYAGGGGGGTVTSFSSGNLSPLFTTSVATSTSTPAQTFTASTAAQNSFLAGPFSGGAGAYSFRSILVVDLPTAIPLANLATQSANTVLGALSSTTPSALAVPSCSGATNALKWTSGTGFGCNTITPGTGTVTVSGSPTTGFIPLFTGAAVIGNSHLDDGVTTASTITMTENLVVNTGGPVNSFGIGTNVFSALPACTSGNEGTMAPVTDSTTNTWGATITGSGSDHVLAYCDGTQWSVAAK
jgi:hypothetical protein